MLCSPEVNFCGMSAEPSFSLAILASRPDVLCYLVFVKLFSALQSTQAANYSSHSCYGVQCFCRSRLLGLLLFRTTKGHLEHFLDESSHGILLIVSKQHFCRKCQIVQDLTF